MDVFQRRLPGNRSAVRQRVRSGTINKTKTGNRMNPNRPFHKNKILLINWIHIECHMNFSSLFVGSYSRIFLGDILHNHVDIFSKY